jgi:HEPN domain-containing protein
MNEAKRQLIESWLTKARNDLMSANVLGTNPVRLLDTAIYHCQQAGEKAVKGFLVFCDRNLVRTHDIEHLIQLAIPHEPGFAAWLNVGRELTPYATLYRYPGAVTIPDRHQFDQAYISAEQLYNFVLSLLPAETHPS